MTDQLCSGGTLVSISAIMQNSKKNKAITVSLACCHTCYAKQFS